MNKYFRIPVDFQHYKDTIEIGKSFDEIAKFLKPDERKQLNIISKDGVCRYWGSIPGESNTRNFNQIEESDDFLCYRSGKYIALAKVGLKIINKELAKFSWGETENGKTWEMIYFFSEVDFFEIDSSIVNKEFGYQTGPVMGFNIISEDKVKAFTSKYHSLENFIKNAGYQENLIEQKTTSEILKNEIIKSPHEAQFYLVSLGNQLDFNTYVPPTDAGHIAFGKKLEELITVHKDELREYVIPKLFDPLSNIDVVWFNHEFRPRYFFEVIQRTGMKEAYARLNTVSSHYDYAKTKIVGPNENYSEFEKARRLYFPTNADQISFKYYKDLLSIYADTMKNKKLLGEFLK